MSDPTKMDGFVSGWQGHTFAVRIDPTVINPMAPGFATRVTVIGDFTLAKLFIGPVSARNPWMVSVNYPLTWNGGDEALITDGSLEAVFGDALSIGVDGSRGFIVSAYIDPGGNGVVGVKYAVPGWGVRTAYGDLADELDKSSLDIWTDQTYFANCMLVQDVDGYYTSPLLVGTPAP